MKEVSAPYAFQMLGCLLVAVVAKPLQLAELLTVCYRKLK